MQMSGTENDRTTSSLALARRVDRVCHEFEIAWRAGHHLRVEHFLNRLSASDRQPLLDELVPLEVELRRAAGEMLHRKEYEDRFPNQAKLILEAFDSTAPIRNPSVPAIPGFRILGEQGRGGMGIVYRAEEIALRRLVALKVLPSQSLQDARHRQRFEREAQAAARLHHTNIVPVFGVGEHDGQPFYVMQFIRGEGLDVVIARLRHVPPAPVGDQDLPHESSSSQAATVILNPRRQVNRTGQQASARARRPVVSLEGVSEDHAGRDPSTRFRWAARVGVQAADALEHAHRQGILHRDIKPSNLILDPHGTVWVSDFGLAKIAGHEDMTATGDILGTLRYMPPEAFENRSDARGDLYALGLVLYELLALQPAFTGRNPRKALEQILTEVPPRLDRLEPAIPRDLVTIVHKAIDHEPGSRYASAGELAADLQRFLDDQPIHARPMGPVERLGRWARRHRTVAVLSASLLLALVAGTCVSTFFAIDAHARAEREEFAARAARAAQVEALRAKKQSDLQAARLELKEALRLAEAGSVDAALFRMIAALRLAPQDEPAADFRRAVRLEFAAWSRQVPWLRYAVRLWDRDEPWRAWWTHPVGPEGETFAFWREGRPVQHRRIATGERPGNSPEWTLAADEMPMALSPNGQWLLTRRTRSAEPCTLQVRHWSTGRPVAEPTLVPLDTAWIPYQSAIASPRWVMTTGRGRPHSGTGPRHFWDLENGRTHSLLLRDDPPSCRLLPDRDGRMIAFSIRGEEDRAGEGACRAEAWDVAAGRPATLPLRLRGNTDPRTDWEGRTLMTIHGDDSATPPTGDGSVRWWDTVTSNLLEHWRPNRKSWFSHLTPDSQTLIGYGHDDRVRLYDLDTGMQRGGSLYLPGIQRVNEVPGGTYPSHPVLLTNLGDGVLRAWDTAHLWPLATAASSPRTRTIRRDRALPRFQAAALSPDAKQAVLALGGRQEYGRLIEVETGGCVGPPLYQPYSQHIAFSRDGRLVATAPQNYWDNQVPIQVHIRDRRTGRPHLPPRSFTRFIHSLAFSPEGQTLAVGCLGEVLLLDPDTGRIRHTLRERSFAASLAFSPDGALLAVAYRSGWPGSGAGVRLWEVASGKPVGKFHPLTSGTGGPQVQFLDAGRLVMVFDPSAATVFLHDPRTGAPISTHLPAGRLHEVVARPGTAIVALSHSGGTVVQWDLRTGMPLGEPMFQPANVSGLEYSPDGRILAVTCADRAVRLWDSRSHLPIGPPLFHAADVQAVRFTPDGHEIVTLGATGVASRWPVHQPVPDEPDLLELWLEAVTGYRQIGRETTLLEIDVWDERCRELHARWPEADLARREQRQAPRTSWHEERARDAQATGNTRGMLWHLERLEKLRPDDWSVVARRGAALAQAGEYAAAEAAFAQAARRGAGAELCEFCAHEGALARHLGHKELERWYRDR